MSDEELRFGLVGAGSLGMAHAREVAADPRAKLVAVADVSEAALADAGDELGLPGDALFADHRSMFEGATLDAVVVATPHTLHYEQVVDALGAGLHVLCEKPLVTEVDHAEDLVRRAAGTDRLLVPGYQRRFWTPYVWAHEWWGEHGSVPTHIDITITQQWGDPGTWRMDSDLGGGGMLYDTGGHLLDALLYITDLTPESVRAEMAFADGERRIDTGANLLVGFEEGARAHVAASGEVGDVHERIDVRGPEASLVLEGEGWFDRTVRATRDDREATLTTGREHHPTTEGFIDAAFEGAEPPVTPYDAYKVTVLTEAAYEAARSGGVVGVDIEDREALLDR